LKTRDQTLTLLDVFPKMERGEGYRWRISRSSIFDSFKPEIDENRRAVNLKSERNELTANYTLYTLIKPHYAL